MLKQIRSLFHPSFIEIYDNALTEEECDILIGAFEKADPKPGVTIKGVNPQYKKCMELKGNVEYPDAVGSIVRNSLCTYLTKYEKKYESINKCPPWKYVKIYNFQKYDGEEDGYKAWHCEHDPAPIPSLRILAWMYYLNDAESGTEFMHYPTIRGKMGRLVIWPAFWTHLHRGVLPNKGLKYIITGWVSYTDNDMFESDDPRSKNEE
tara:strand:+ start:284 stop:904 length:621 start_codon:yes stop_codon:yes gene_type:complete